MIEKHHCEINMPHSTMAEPKPAPDQMDVDTDLPDATITKNTDIDEESDSGTLTDGAQKQDVKLEDLFNDEGSDDEEFPSSSIPVGKVESSPPAAPVWV